MKAKGTQFDLQSYDKPTQLPMFMPASELRDEVTATADMPGKSPDEVFDIKVTDAMAPASAGTHGAGVYNSVEKEGVKSPVQLIHGQDTVMLGQGHHRTASADFASSIHKKPYWTPVVHTDARQHDWYTLINDDIVGEDAFGRPSKARELAVQDATQFSEVTQDRSSDRSWSNHLEASRWGAINNSVAMKGFGVTGQEQNNLNAFSRRQGKLNSIVPRLPPR